MTNTTTQQDPSNPVATSSPPRLGQVRRSFAVGAVVLAGIVGTALGVSVADPDSSPAAPATTSATETTVATATTYGRDPLACPGGPRLGRPGYC